MRCQIAKNGICKTGKRRPRRACLVELRGVLPSTRLRLAHAEVGEPRDTPQGERGILRVRGRMGGGRGQIRGVRPGRAEEKEIPSMPIEWNSEASRRGISALWGCLSCNKGQAACEELLGVFGGRRRASAAPA
jgi:hypothetical protein